ncbi:MAG: Fe-S protein [Gammaproteobacteria bacterium]|nr:Fe-S protein [Gammaproteobacteria bacterium]
MIFFSNKNRPFHYGPYPLERLPRDELIIEFERQRGQNTGPAAGNGASSNYAAALAKYHAIFKQFCEGAVAPARAPVPDDLDRRSIDVKGAGYFLDAGQIGICGLTASCWYRDTTPKDHTHGIVVLAEYSRLPEAGNPARNWLEGSIHATAQMRAFEIAVGIANHIRAMGFDAAAYDDRNDQIDIDRLTVLAGLGVRDNGVVVNPYLDADFSVAVVTTNYALATDKPLKAKAKNGRSPAYWLGIGGATSGLERWRRANRQTHLSNYPMEQVRRTDRPTTLILDDEVPRVPKRAAFFERAIHGDLDKKAQVERQRFSFKHPFAAAMLKQIRGMVPHQDGPVAATQASGTNDPVANTRALKSLSYALGSEITGICEIPDYAWYSHKEDGSEIKPYHKYAVVCLIDQGYDTMEGASGDDFISGAQSMRAYMRGALIAGIMAEHLRSLGHSARPQTNADSHVLHIPLVMWAGLGELSRIGELVLNPFIGPRFKTVVMTTDLPLVPDKPVDFGLQYFCSNCLKCARECPCDAIPFGDKVMFNGYEMWKPDVERCTRYRLTNQRGLACGRCMKTCPLNKVISWDGPLATQVASWCGVNAFWLKPLLVPLAVRLDDLLGHGIRVPAKKWWLDLEIVDGVCVHPRKGVNQRDLDVNRKIDVQKHKVAYYHADMMPPPNSSGIAMMVKRKDGIAAAVKVETVEQALARKAKGGPAPEHYIPTPPMDTSASDKEDVTGFNPYHN